MRPSVSGGPRRSSDLRLRRPGPLRARRYSRLLRLRRCVLGLGLGGAERDRLDDLLRRRLLSLVDADVAAKSQNGDPVRDLEDVVQVVRDEDDREPLFTQTPDEIE